MQRNLHTDLSLDERIDKYVRESQLIMIDTRFGFVDFSDMRIEDFDRENVLEASLVAVDNVWIVLRELMSNAQPMLGIREVPVGLQDKHWPLKYLNAVRVDKDNYSICDRYYRPFDYKELTEKK